MGRPSHGGTGSRVIRGMRTSQAERASGWWVGAAEVCPDLDTPSHAAVTFALCISGQGVCGGGGGAFVKSRGIWDSPSPHILFPLRHRGHTDAGGLIVAHARHRPLCVRVTPPPLFMKGSLNGCDPAHTKESTRLS